jgi:hypothetical protein
MEGEDLMTGGPVCRGACGHGEGRLRAELRDSVCYAHVVISLEFEDSGFEETSGVQVFSGLHEPDDLVFQFIERDAHGVGQPRAGFER